MFKLVNILYHRKLNSRKFNSIKKKKINLFIYKNKFLLHNSFWYTLDKLKYINFKTIAINNTEYKNVDVYNTKNYYISKLPDNPLYFIQINQPSNKNFYIQILDTEFKVMLLLKKKELINEEIDSDMHILLTQLMQHTLGNELLIVFKIHNVAYRIFFLESIYSFINNFFLLNYKTRISFIILKPNNFFIKVNKKKIKSIKKSRKKILYKTYGLLTKTYGFENK